MSPHSIAQVFNLSKLFQVSPIKTLASGKQIRHLGLKDGSGTAKVVLFEESA